MSAAEPKPGPPGVNALAPGQLEVTGELTFNTVAELLARGRSLLPADASTLTIDLAGVARADSAGIALLLEWLRLARAAGGELRYINIPGQVRDLIAVSGLKTAFSLN